MRRVRYSVACSLDGFIAGPNDEADWIIMDPDIDFTAIFGQFDTILLGRRTWEYMERQGGAAMPGMTIYVFSRTLSAEDYPDLKIVGEDAAEVLTDLKARDGKDIWLFGGGLLFRSLAAQGLVDGVDVAVIPVLLGEGIPLFPSPAPRVDLELVSHRIYEKTGTVGLEYSVKTT